MSLLDEHYSAIKLDVSQNQYDGWKFRPDDWDVVMGLGSFEYWAQRPEDLDEDCEQVICKLSALRARLIAYGVFE